jgi:cyclase
MESTARHRTLIVARLTPGHDQHVAEAFAESDRTQLPHLVGVSSRTLFTFHDLYFHLIESHRDPRVALPAVRDNPLWTEVNQRLAEHVVPYDAGWSQPSDAMAHEFYHWSAP